MKIINNRSGVVAFAYSNLKSTYRYFSKNTQQKALKIQCKK